MRTAKDAERATGRKVLMLTKDPTGSLSASLRGHADVGDRLFRSGSRLRNPAGFESWHEELGDWRARTTRSLAGRFEQEAVEQFIQEGVTVARDESWHRELKAQLRALRNEIEFLDSLRGTLVRQALERRRRFERSHRHAA